MPERLDVTTLFSSLQSELNARVIARASINSAHIQTILLFIGGYIISKYTTPTPAGPNFLAPFLICGIIPMISWYFISIYAHNDMQIGLLNRTLRRIEDVSGIDDKLRFFKRESDSGSKSFHARQQSHFAVFMLCLVSPIIIFTDKLIYMILNKKTELILDHPTLIVISIVIFLSLINIITLIRLNKARALLANME